MTKSFNYIEKNNKKYTKLISDKFAYFLQKN